MIKMLEIERAIIYPNWFDQFPNIIVQPVIKDRLNSNLWGDNSTVYY
jgi:hypothetical protein